MLTMDDEIFDMVEPDVNEVADPLCVLAMPISVTEPDDAVVSALNTKVTEFDEQSAEVTVAAWAEKAKTDDAASAKANFFIINPFKNLIQVGLIIFGAKHVA